MSLIEDFILPQLKFISYFGESIFYLLPIALLVSLGFFKTKHRTEGALILVSLLSYFYSIILKFIFQVQRPPTASYTDFINQYSFPSSHVVVYTAFFGYLIFLTLFLKRFDKLLRFVILILSLYFLSFVGISRVVLGEHWPTDVLWGYLFGAVYLGILIVLHKNSVPKDKN
ncbi:hypothetical protein A2619_00365 [candidate division WWE3 bacterium RIFOXYD1_FULL_39_9]|uniref:Phosphatidic acid phosphatase type 2/haloperoxidase domain-containing protein n=1 Tax=candidate division WWE3 bacterium RIFOXYD1_FULL_39_9 TaxID=1802649 RepID=A0A1F4X669_UNCKA|nr:MAG: hypothetical protein A2619_00365 [candidate division WWE3 bacterium RIFOXYD1_FULL_39_9]